MVTAAHLLRLMDERCLSAKGEQAEEREEREREEERARLRSVTCVFNEVGEMI